VFRRVMAHCLPNLLRLLRLRKLWISNNFAHPRSMHTIHQSLQKKHRPSDPVVHTDAKGLPLPSLMALPLLLCFMESQGICPLHLPSLQAPRREAVPSTLLRLYGRLLSIEFPQRKSHRLRGAPALPYFPHIHRHQGHPPSLPRCQSDHRHRTGSHHRIIHRNALRTHTCDPLDMLPDQ
jgi:hypothetical protein